MGCRCNEDKKKDLQLAIKLATTYSSIEKIDVQIYFTFTRRFNKVFKVYNFEPLNDKRQNIIKKIKYINN